MKTILIKKLKVCKFIFLFSCTFSSHANINNFNYVGTDAIFSSTNFKKDFGANIISKKLTPGLNLFIGHMFNQNFGVEFGVEFYKKMNRTENLIGNGAIVLGEKLPVGPPEYWESHKTSFNQKHMYIGIISKVHIAGNNFFSLLTGLSLSRMKFWHNVFDDSDGYIRRDGQIVGIFCKNSIVPIIRIALEHKFNDKMGARVLISWNNSNAFKKIKPITNKSAKPTIKPKDTYKFGVGLIYYI